MSKQKSLDISCIYLHHLYITAGDSAGGNLAASVSLALRDMQKTPQLKLQVLLYPCVQSIDLLLPSYVENQYDSLLPQDVMAMMWLMYATGKST